MPEFILDKGSAADSQRFDDLAPFVRGYIEAMFFTSTGTGDDGDLESAAFADLAPEALESIIADCEAFQKDAAGLLANAYKRKDAKGVAYDEEAAGRDLWYTRNGHGVGFWDRDALDAHGLGDDLAALCGTFTKHTERSIYLGDDERIHYCGG